MALKKEEIPRLSCNVNIDKNIAYNIKDLRRKKDRQTEIIIKSLLIYFGHSYQNDIFGYKTLDPNKFAKEMNINVTDLFRKHPNPEFLKDGNSYSSSKKWDSYLENALYILLTKPLYGEYVSRDEHFDKVSIKSFLILNELEEYTEKRSNKGPFKKTYYKYKLDDFFERNVRRFFLQANLKHFIDAKNRKYEELYLYLKNKYSENKCRQDIFYMSFDFVREMLSISSEIEPRFQKQKINRSFKFIQGIMQEEVPSLELGWVKGKGQRYAYVPVLKWEKVDESLSKKENELIQWGIFFKFVKRKLFEVYSMQARNKIKTPESFYHWLKDKNNRSMIISTWISSYGLHAQVKDVKEYILNRDAEKFYQRILEARCIEEINQCFQFDEKWKIKE